MSYGRLIYVCTLLEMGQKYNSLVYLHGRSKHFVSGPARGVAKHKCSIVKS